MTSIPAPPPGVIRVVLADGAERRDPAEAWERTATPAEVTELQTRRFARLPHRPANEGEVPAGARAALEAVLGRLDLRQLLVIPRHVRVVGGDAGPLVVSPAQVLGLGPDRLAAWLDDPAGARVRAIVPFDEVLAIFDRTVLLLGRLELVGREGSLVVRYNTVGRAEVRDLLRAIRLGSGADSGLVPATGRDPATLPHKWMGLVRSPDVHPAELGPMAVAAGAVGARRAPLHDGVAVLTGSELIVATDPTPDTQLAQYGVDLVVVGRERVRSLRGAGDTLTIDIDAWPGSIELRLHASPPLVAEAAALLGPALSTGG